MPIRRALTITWLSFAALFAANAFAAKVEKLSLTAREIRYEVSCHSPRDVPCAIKKPVLSGYSVLNEKISLDDQGSYWIADLSKTRPGQNEPIRVLSDNGVLHLIEVKFVAAPAARVARKKPDNDVKTASKMPEKPDPAKPAGNTKTAAGPKAKTISKIEACYESCRSTP